MILVLVLWQSANTEDAVDSKDNVVNDQMPELVEIKAIQEFITEADFAFYQKLVDFLMPDVRKPKGRCSYCT